jgi:uncharacterized radical SAM superfamily Fe-S cluster-containing enzyme
MQKQDADYIFHELIRSICPECKKVIDAQIIIRDNKVFMRKRCPDHGWFEGIISSDAQMYVDSVKFNKPGTLPLEFSTEVKDGCPLDCSARSTSSTCAWPSSRSIPPATSTAPSVSPTPAWDSA